MCVVQSGTYVAGHDEVAQDGEGGQGREDEVNIDIGETLYGG